MTIHEARLIREFKKRCTYRRLAEIYYPEDENGHGNQGFGEDLCKEALEVLYPNKEWISLMVDSSDKGYKFGQENKSYLGDFMWWE